MKKWYIVLILELSILIWLVDVKSYIFISFLWVMMHEVAHILTAGKFGCKFNNININIFGVNAELSNIDELTEKRKLIVYLSGPLFNFFMTVSMYFIYNY